MEAEAYIRVSSRAQNYATQRSAIERAAAAAGDTITEWHAEKRSARAIDRPILDQLRARGRAAGGRAGGRRVLYVFKYDRVCRSGVRDLLNALHDLAGAFDVVAVADVVDLTGPAAEMILSALAFAARLERQALNERISAARERVEQEGGSWGRPRRSLDLARARALAAEGKSQRAIAAALQVPRSTVRRALARVKKMPAPAAAKGGTRKGPAGRSPAAGR